jgi:hypothetical protein
MQTGINKKALFDEEWGFFMVFRSALSVKTCFVGIGFHQTGQL